MNNEGKQLSLRLTASDLAKIDALIKKGYAMNRVDFMRQAIREKCFGHGIEIEGEKTKQVIFNPSPDEI